MNEDSLHPPAWGQLITAGLNQTLNVPEKPIVGFIEGDGVGTDIWNAARPVFDCAVQHASSGTREIAWWEILAGEKSFQRTGEYLPKASVQSIEQVKVVIKGPLTTPVGGGFRSLNVSLRKELDLYACIRPIQYIPGTPAPVVRPEDVDMVVFRENTEDVYAGIEWKSCSEGAQKVIHFLEEDMGVRLNPFSGIGIKPISPQATKRLVRRAIEYAIHNGKNRVTLVHKGNIMKFTEGAFRDWGYELARDEFPDEVITEDMVVREHGGLIPQGKILLNDRIADAMFQQVLLRPKEYQILAVPNLNGDYLSDALAAQVGGLGMAPGANVGDSCAVFEATHGSAPKYAGMDKVNPSSLLLSGAMMFRHMGWNEVADLIVMAISAVIRSGTVTYDLARLMPKATEVSCSGFAKALIKHIGSVRCAEGKQ